jgi:hypothetical protein
MGARVYLLCGQDTLRERESVCECLYVCVMSVREVFFLRECM